MDRLETRLQQLRAGLEIELIRYEGNARGDVHKIPVTGAGRHRAQLHQAVWDLDLQVVAMESGLFDCTLTATIIDGACPNGSFGVTLTVDQWSTQNYVLMPAALYKGNRYRSIGSHRREDLPDPGPDMPVTIGNVPRLNWTDGPSEVQLLTGDCSTPAIGYQAPATGAGFLILTPQASGLGDSGLSIRESEDRQRADIMLKAPGVREHTTYQGRRSTDRGALLMPGDTASLSFALAFFNAATVPELFNRFFELRNYYRGDICYHHEIPFSATWDIQEAKYNSQNWVEADGYYSVGMRECSSQDWQTGWVGGPNAAYALLCAGNDESRERAMRMFDFLADGGMAPNGLLLESFHHGEWLPSKALFMRYQGDSLYFMLKMLMLSAARDPSFTPKTAWLFMLRGVADALCRIWHRYHSFPQFVYADSDEVWLSGTAAASLVPGALALASVYFEKPEYLEVACAGGRYFSEQHVATGELNGGPGDILQAIDSESAAAMLESFVTLSEVTQDPSWLTLAEQTAQQCASWVVTYDFVFPPETTFGRLGMQTTGTVYANVQNKHSAPGICTLSGCSLLKLYRATGDERYLDLIREIAHAIPQYMSRVDRPICDRRENKPWPVMAPGWINERVNMSDWEVRGEPWEEIGVGEIFGGSTWSEAAMLLTKAELPGIYVQPDTRLLCVLDHVDAEIMDGDAGSIVLQIHNPTAFDARVSVLSETRVACAHPLGANPCTDLPKVYIPAGERVVFSCS